jgi:arginyl-tRNA synthetase
MRTVLHTLGDLFSQALLKAYPALGDMRSAIIAEIAPSTQEKFGHYQCNIAMKLTKQLQQSPRDIAGTIVKQIDTSIQEGEWQGPIIAKLEIAGPGFINITLDPQYLSQRIQTILNSPSLAIEKGKKQRIVIDFSSPNTAKEMHVGHLRSTIIGDSLARLFEFQGHDVLRLNHIGDWGTAFGMLIAYMKKEAPKVLQGSEGSDLPHLMHWYKSSKQLFDADPLFKKQSQQEVVALQGGNPESLKAWEIICDISRKAYQEIYDLLGVDIIERGESFYNPMLPEVVADLESKGLVQISDGAKCIFLEGFQNREGDPLPLMIQKSDGGYNYDTTDMAAIRHRINDEKANRIVILSDAGQSQHFQMIFEAAKKAGYLDPNKVRVDHVPFGLVLGSDGKKFRTRSGETEKLIDLLTNGIKHAKEILDQRSPEMNDEDKNRLARSLGIAALKYADLCCHRTGDYTFSYERMLRFEGNTAAFLMYSYVRINGIKRKVNIPIDQLKGTQIQLQHPSEISLAIHLARFPDILDEMSNELLPNRLTDYLYLLAEKFNAFFRDCRVEGDPQQNPRLLLCEAVARTMHQGLHILGVETVEKM